MSVPVEWAVMSMSSGSPARSAEVDDERDVSWVCPVVLADIPQHGVSGSPDLFGDLRYVEGHRIVYVAGRKCTSFSFVCWLRVQLARGVVNEGVLEDFQRAVVKLSARLRSLVDGSCGVSQRRSSVIRKGEDLWNAFVEILRVSSIGIPSGDVYDDRRLFLRTASSLLRSGGRFGCFVEDVRGWNRGCAVLFMGKCNVDGPFI